MSDVQTEEQSSKDSRYFRPFIGVLCVLGSLLGFAGLYFVEIPGSNDKALMFAMGIVFGWGSMVVSSEYGSTATGRKVAESAIRKIERQDIAAVQPVPAVQDVNVVNPPTDPANVQETPKGQTP